jgi:hypothetical protein
VQAARPVQTRTRHGRWNPHHVDEIADLPVWKAPRPLRETAYAPRNETMKADTASPIAFGLSSGTAMVGQPRRTTKCPTE